MNHILHAGFKAIDAGKAALIRTAFPRVALATAIAFCSIPLALAAPLSYDETISGDLANGFPSPLPPFNFDVGINTFTGELDFAAPAATNDIFDTFNFKVGPGLEITSIEFALLSKEIIGGVGQAEPAMTLVDSAFPSLPIAAISIDALAVTPPSSVFVLSGLPIGPGVYNGLFSFSGGSVLPFSARVGYEAKFTVAAASVVRSHQHFCC